MCYVNSSIGQKTLHYFRKSSTFCPTTQEPQKVEVYRNVFSLRWVVSECTLSDAQNNVLCNAHTVTQRNGAKQASTILLFYTLKLIH